MQKKTINIEGYEFYNFGENNYSNGMKLIYSSDRPKEILQKVLAKEAGFENIWLNPSAKCSDFEFFGVLGTEEQYLQFYKTQKNAIIGDRMVKMFGWTNWPPRRITEAYKTQLLDSYKDWWELDKKF